MPLLDAEDQIAAINAASAPHMDSAGRRELTGAYEQLISSAGGRPPAASDADLAAIGIKTVRVPERVSDG